MSHLQAKHLEEYKRYTNDSSKSCKTQSTLHSFSRVCPPERATAIAKRIAEFVARDLCPTMGRASGLVTASFIKTRWVEAVFILQLSVCFTYRIFGCRKLTSVAALVQMVDNTI